MPFEQDRAAYLQVDECDRTLRGNRGGGSTFNNDRLSLQFATGFARRGTWDGVINRNPRLECSLYTNKKRFMPTTINSWITFAGTHPLSPILLAC